MAGMSRGSMTSSGSKGIRNLLGGKFAQRANSIRKVETKAENGPASGQSKQLGKEKVVIDGDGTILEDDSDIDGDLSADALNYNYDVINLKEDTNPYHNAIKDVLTAYYKHIGEDKNEENDPTRALQSRTLMAVDIQYYMKLGAEP